MSTTSRPLRWRSCASIPMPLPIREAPWLSNVRTDECSSVVEDVVSHCCSVALNDGADVGDCCSGSKKRLICDFSTGPEVEVALLRGLAVRACYLRGVLDLLLDNGLNPTCKSWLPGDPSKPVGAESSAASPDVGFRGSRRVFPRVLISGSSMSDRPIFGCDGFLAPTELSLVG